MGREEVFKICLVIKFYAIFPSKSKYKLFTVQINIPVTIRPVTPGQKPLTQEQLSSLQWIAQLKSGRDVVLAIDITESVGLNDAGRNSLRQIVKDSLDPGDTVYIVPFGSDVLLTTKSLEKPLGEPIELKEKNETTIKKILDQVPLNADLTVQNTDIQQAELIIYQGIAQINQNRLYRNEKVKPQSVVWVTDAPLNLGDAKEWKETPFSSPFRNINSPENQDRQKWLKSFNISDNKRELKNEKFTLTVVDLPPTVQESCTPAPGGKESCLVDNYINGQLWLPKTVIGVVLAIALVSLGFYLNWWLKTKKVWEIKVDMESGMDDETPVIKLANNDVIGIGGIDDRTRDGITWRNSELRGYIERRGNQVYLVPDSAESMEMNGKEVTKKTKITDSRINLKCVDQQGMDCYLELRFSK